jgi:3-mercaptopyruvate sulfurtransferase SseA
MGNLAKVLNQILSDRKNLWLRVLLDCFLVITIAILVVWLIQWKQTYQLRLNDQSILASRGSNPEIPRTPLAEAKNAFDRQEAIFLDVRSSESYKTSHIQGALNIPFSEILDRYRQLDSARWIILYCT